MELTVIPHIDIEECHLYCVSDVHLGSPDCDEALLSHDIAMIGSDPQARVIINGDLLQMDTKTSKGDVYHQVYSPGKQRDMAEQYLTPIKDRILAMLGGNHDEGRSQEDGTPIKDLSRFLGVTYCDTEACLKVSVGAKRKNGKPAVYTVYATHGWSNGRQVGSKANSLHGLSNVVLADIYFVSHTHTQMAFPDVFYVPDLYNNNVRAVRRYYVNAGSYQRRGRYPKSKGMRPTVLGTPMVRLSGTDKAVSVVL